MPESKAVIGLTWEPKLPALPFQSKTLSGSDSKSQNEPQSTVLWKPNKHLFDGLFLPNGPSKFDMPVPTLTLKLKKDLQLLELRGAIYPERQYKKDSGSKALPRYFQVGTVVDSVIDHYSGRMTKESKPTLADELLSDPAVRQYRMHKVREIEAQNRPAENQKWKIKGRQTFKRAKHQRL